MMSVAALAATTAATCPSLASTSGTATIIEHSGSGVTYCDQIDLTWSGNNYADIHNWTPCGISSESHGMGIQGYTAGVTDKKKKKTSKPNNVALSDYYVGDVDAGYDVDFQLGLPLKNGGAFNGLYTTNGTSVTQYITGSYSLGTPGETHKGPSTIDALRAYLKAHGE
jgi:hypothetical protein